MGDGTPPATSGDCWCLVARLDNETYAGAAAMPGASRARLDWHNQLVSAASYFLPRYTSSVNGSPCDVGPAPIVTNVMVKLSFGTEPCQCIVLAGM